MSNKGWVKIDRQIQDHWIYTDKPFNRSMAWIDLILSVCHEPQEFVYKGQLIKLKRGQMITSPSKLAEKWGWSRNKVYRFLEQLNCEGMVTRTATPSGTLLTLENYGFFQGERTPNGTPNEPPDEPSDGTPDGTHTRMYKNDKERKEIKEKSKGDFPQVRKYYE